MNYTNARALISRAYLAKKINWRDYIALNKTLDKMIRRQLGFK